MESKITDKQFFSFLKFVPYNFFDLWDSKRYTSQILKSSYPIVILNNYITEQNEKFRIFEKENEDFGILGVNNVEGIFDAYISKGKNINQPYKKMEIGWLAYNPYRVNVGSIGIKKECHKHNYISPAYVVFSCKQGLMPEFLYLIFKSNYYNRVIRENTTGSVRQNLSFDILKKMEIPFPPVSEQKRIVDTYNQKIEAAKQLEKEAEEIEKNIENSLYKILGIEKRTISVKTKGLQFTNFYSIEEWGFDKIISRSRSINSTFKNLNIAEFAIEAFRGKSPKYKNDSHYFILNQKCNRWNSIDLSFVKYVDENWYLSVNKNFFTKEGDILINSTGEGTIGRATYIKKEYQGLLFDSHIILLRIDKNKMNPELFVELFNSSFGQDQVNDLKSAQATKQTELGVTNLFKICMPVPDTMEFQNEILTKIRNERMTVQKLKIQAEQYRKQAKEEFEKEIFN